MSENQWKQAKDDAVIPEYAILAGVKESARSGNYQVWISLYGSDISVVFASKDIAGANEVSALMQARYKSGLLAEVSQMTEFIDMLDARGDATKRVPFTPKELAEIGQFISEEVSKRTKIKAILLDKDFLKPN